MPVPDIAERERHRRLEIAASAPLSNVHRLYALEVAVGLVELTTNQRESAEHLERFEAAPGIGARLCEQALRAQLHAVEFAALQFERDLDYAVIQLRRKSARALGERTLSIGIASAVQLRRREMVEQECDGRIGFDRSTVERFRAREVAEIHVHAAKIGEPPHVRRVERQQRPIGRDRAIGQPDRREVAASSTEALELG